MESSTAIASVETLTESPPENIPSANAVRNVLHGPAGRAMRNEAITSKRRKASIQELRSGPMTTVQEICLDSRKDICATAAATSYMSLPDLATIPGHLPGQTIRPTIDRLSSFPDESFLRLKEGRAPREALLAEADNRIIATRLEPLEMPKNEVERRSLLLESKALKPLVIPSTANANLKPVQWRVDNNGEVEDVPPKVPPKSPRTESRASPRGNSSRAANAANRSLSTSTSATSATSSHSFHSFSGNPSQWSARTPIRNGSLSPTQRVLENVVAGGPSPARHESPSRQLRSVDWLGAMRPRLDNRSESPSAKIRAGYNATNGAPPLPRAKTSPGTPFVSSDGSLSQPRNKKSTRAETPQLDTGQKTVLHQRGKSEPAHLSTPARRPMFKEPDPTSIYGLLQTMVRSPAHYDGQKDLPSGFRAIDATAKVPAAEMKALQRQAGKQVEKFEVLQSKDVSTLTQELKLLDERCAYLQSTHQSLRQGRRNLHIRMITYLKSARLSKSSLDSILKQEEALAELDVSIDEWVAKLEAAEERRVQIRQRLLEHIAAAVTLQISAKPGTVKAEEPTPPVSPEEEEYIRTERRDVQSIKVYADKGVAALLAEIEKEIDSLGEPGNQF